MSGGTSTPDCSFTFPLRLRCTGTDELLVAEGLEDAVARALGRAFDRARQTLPASAVVLRPPELVRGDLAPDQQATLLARLNRAIERAARSRSLPVAPPPAEQAKPPPEPWRVQIKAEFRITPRRFFETRRKFAAHPADDSPDPLELYFPLLDQPMQATAWVTEVLAEREFNAHTQEVTTRFAETRPTDERVWGVHGWVELRALVAEADPRLATRIPEFGPRGFVDMRPGPAEGERQAILRPGAWTLSVFLPLPDTVLPTLIEQKPLQTVDVPLREAAALGTPADFAAEARLDLPTALREAPDALVTVVVTPFTVRRRTHEHTLAALFEQYRRDTFNGGRLGTVVPLTPSALARLGPTLGPFLTALATPGQTPADGFWPPGSAGANLTPLIANLNKQTRRTANAAFISSEASEAERILHTENGFWSADRDNALRGFLTRWTTKVGDPPLFELLLDELDRRGRLQAFVQAISDLPATNTPLKRDVVALANRDPRIARVAETIETLVREVQKNHYDVDTQEIWINRDPDRKLRTAGESSDNASGVVATVEPYYAESSRILQPKPEILDRLREPTRKKVSELVGRMVCRPGEPMTREQLLRKAVQEAAKELPPLEEKDLMKVTLLKSVRVLRLERRRERGIDEIYVHYQPVQKVGDTPWMPAGGVRVEVPAGFEAYLTTYHVRHMESALTVLLMGEAVVLGGVMILELGVATIGRLLFFVSTQVVIYRFTTDAEDRTLEGYLGAALKGELDAVGFKILAGAVKQLGGFAAGHLVTRQLVDQVATKWIVYGIRGFATAVGVGGLEVTYQFAGDLLHYSHCEGWSAPEKYWDRFKAGVILTLAFEFLAAPILTPPIRLALEKASTAWQAAQALRASGKSLREIAELLLKGAAEVESALGRTLGHDAVPTLVRGFRHKIGEVLKALAREYESRAYRSLLDLYGPELTNEALTTLQRLLRLAGEQQLDALLQRALTASHTPHEILQRLSRAEDSLLTELARTGKLAELATLDDSTVRTLRQLHDAKVHIGAFFDGSGPSPKTFTDEFAKLPEARRAAALENAEGRTPKQLLDRAGAEPRDDILRKLAASGFTEDDVRAFMGDRTRLRVELVRRVARLVAKYGPAETRAYGRYLARRKVYLTDKMATLLLENVPKGKLKTAITEKRRLLRVEDETPPLGLSEEDLADLSIRETEPPRTHFGTQGVERPLRDVVETPGSRALRASLIARDGVEPPEGYHAHHIVPENAFRPGLDWLRDRLAEARCGIDEAGNGVFLAGSFETANPELTRLHNSYIHAGVTKEYAYTLTRRLGHLHGDALLREIDAIAEEMRTGDFDILKIPHGQQTKWEPGMSAPPDPTEKPEQIE